ncbi:MAG: hypothetical protein FJX62_02975 [Alphaproteobacteria bacterium]|nr:hypothetical protein [Alphaproteobacteria bacterium]
MSEVAYRLSVAPELDRFRPEIEFACDFLDLSHFVVRAPDGARVLHYGPNAPAGAVTVPAALFPEGVQVDADGLHPEREALARLVALKEAGLLPPQGDASSPLRYDAIGLIVLLLSRLEERGHPARSREHDRYGRFPVGAALIAPDDGRLYPWADRAARDLAAAITGEPRPASRTHYAVKFTHDVDRLRGYHRPFEPIRNAAGDLLKRGNPRAALSRLKKSYLNGEPWRSARRLMDLSERHGIASHFYFMGPSEDTRDSPYVLSMPDLLRALTGEIRERGHVVGFHPGARTPADADEWRRQKDGLETVISMPVTEGRQHTLRYDAEATPRIWSDAGMTLDCTLAYPEVVGFRSGTCRPHRAYDLVARRALPLKQISTAVMEFGLIGGRYFDHPVSKVLADSLWARGVCREFGGTFTILLHTGQSDPRLWNWIEALLPEVA